MHVYSLEIKQLPFGWRKEKGVQVAVLNLVPSFAIRASALFLPIWQSFSGEGSETTIASEETRLHPQDWSKARSSFPAILCLWHKLGKQITRNSRDLWKQYDVSLMEWPFHTLNQYSWVGKSSTAWLPSVLLISKMTWAVAQETKPQVLNGLQETAMKFL